MRLFHSIKMKIILLVMSGIVMSSLAIGFMSIISSYKAVGNDSIQIMNLLCDNNAKDINRIFANIENSVDMLSVYAKQQLKDVQRFKDNEDYVNTYSQNMIETAVHAAMNTDGVIAVYLRYNTDFTKPTSGFFYTKKTNSTNYKASVPTNILKYQKSEKEYVGWYYEPYEAKRAVWLSPYVNKNLDKKIISYVKPIYMNNTFIGVLGMDVDFSVLQNAVKKTTIYQSGYAFLTDQDARIVYHNKLPAGTSLSDYNHGEFKEMSEILKSGNVVKSSLMEYSFFGVEKKLSFRMLNNDMRLVLSVPTEEIDAEANQLLTQILIISLGIIIILGVITIIFTNRLVRPLLELTVAAKRITAGDLNVNITHESNDEVGSLSESLRQTVYYLERYFSYIQNIAYRDSLTGVENKTAYMDKITELNEKIQQGIAEFSVAVFDLNDLKHINDTYGHSFGDKAIIEMSHIICKVFVKGIIYRIGGDEFAVIMTQKEQLDALFLKFYEEIEEVNAYAKTIYHFHVACGYAEFQQGYDRDYEAVFQRADLAMYKNKLQLKNN